MNFINKINLFFTNLFDKDEKYVKLFLYSFLVIFILKLIEKLIIFIIFKIKCNNKFRFNFRKKYVLINSVIIFLFIIFIWEEFLLKFITLLSFVTAAIAYSLRDTIINFFTGIYIRVSKPFTVEDRIMIDGYMGDVINISTLSFDILEVDSHTFQSTGTIVHVPNSKIFSSITKNYIKAFKYIWDEIEVKVTIDSDIKSAKSKLYKIVNSNEVIKRIPNKMKGALEANDKYRIYYNKLEPIIYMDFNDSYISLYIRFLIHPKKKRNIENEIWNEIYKCYNNKELSLYVEK